MSVLLQVYAFTQPQLSWMSIPSLAVLNGEVHGSTVTGL